MKTLANARKLDYSKPVPRGMEPKNSCTKRNPHPIESGFFAPGHLLMAGRATDTRPFGERSPPVFVQVLSLPATKPEATKSASGEVRN